MKTCIECGKTKPKNNFRKHAIAYDGLQCHCKDCVAIASAAWNAAHKSPWYKANPDRIRANSAAWAAANPGKVKARAAAWRKDNQDKVKASTAEWRAANPEAVRVYNQNYRARKRANGGKLSIGLAVRLLIHQRGKCACGCKQHLGDDYHLDHIMPLALGGTNTDDNVQLLTATCNLQKSAKHPVDFMRQRGFLL